MVVEHAESSPGSFGIVLLWSLGAVPCIWSVLVWFWSRFGVIIEDSGGIPDISGPLELSGVVAHAVLSSLVQQGCRP